MAAKTQSGMAAKAGPRGMNSYFLSYPVFCAASDGEGLLITGGGGGGKAYGVINYLQAHVVISTQGGITVETIATLDTGADAPTALDYCPSQGGVWACALGNSCMLLKFNDESLSIETLFKFKSETSGSEREMTNFVKIFDNKKTLILITGGENKVVRVWNVVQNSSAQLVHEVADHQAEIVDADFFNANFLSCGKEGTVKVWNMDKILAQIRPEPVDMKFQAQKLSIRSAYFINSSEIVILCHHPRGPAYLFVYNYLSPAKPVSHVCLSANQIAPSMGLNAARTKVVVSLAGGEKEIYAIPSLRRLHRTHKHCHEMPPGKTLFLNSEDLVLCPVGPASDSGRAVFVGRNRSDH